MLFRSDEVAAAHPGQRRTPDSSKRYMNRPYTEVVAELEGAGFAIIVTESLRKAKKGLFSKEGSIAKISINGQTQFEKGEWFAEESVIRITYITYSVMEITETEE